MRPAFAALLLAGLLLATTAAHTSAAAPAPLPDDAASTGGAPEGWTNLDQGLDFGRFPAGRAGFGGDSTVVVLRADPAFWSLDFLSADTAPDRALRTAREWCETGDLTAAINAGMFATDYMTHVGYCAVRGHVNSAGVTDYQSLAAFCPRRDDVPPFRILDRDDPGVTIEAVRDDYACVVQNLRLIKRPGRNRWSPQPKRWSEAALGEDGQGRILFIFCRTGYSMHDFNRILLSLPIGLVCAQHLEGGPEAQLLSLIHI